ncbi:hypothetical protein [Tahibacter amnicola]|uniref:Uncharacterized protein n=1 Tax=Tahibacter amnicola TaxID=2976241 RepID=A0ABY6BCC1_9GAMM|nr:hypothetical protein [Tahibacter amnicola]UXI67686.1 hypothetical protein N4264_23590 [Tahibacter amnicola]
MRSVIPFLAYRQRLATVLLCGIAVAPALARASDAGMHAGHLRTDYEAGRGTAVLPLSLPYDQAGIEGCLFDAASSFAACPGRRGDAWSGALQTRAACGGDATPSALSWRGCREFADSPALASPGAGATYWVIHANDDPSFDQCNEGPPGLSHRVYSLADPTSSAVFRAGTEPLFGTTGRVAKISVDLGARQIACAAIGGNRFSVPFLSLGSQAGRGDAMPMGTLRAGQSGRATVHFDAAITHYAPPGAVPAAAISARRRRRAYTPVCLHSRPGTACRTCFSSTCSAWAHWMPGSARPARRAGTGRLPTACSIQAPSWH